MSTLKITSAENDGSFDFNGDTFYKQIITFDNGESGQVNAKTEGKWKVGDEVEVKGRKESKYGTRFQIGKPQQGGFSGGGGKKSVGGFALSWAKKAVIAGKVPLEEIEEFAKELKDYAEGITHGSVVVSYANDLFCDGFFKRDQIKAAAEKFSSMLDRI